MFLCWLWPGKCLLEKKKMYSDIYTKTVNVKILLVKLLRFFFNLLNVRLSSYHLAKFINHGFKNWLKHFEESVSKAHVNDCLSEAVTRKSKISLKTNFCYSFSPMNFPTFFGKFLFIAHIRQLPLVVLLQHTISYIKSCTNSHKEFLEPFLNYFYRFFIYNL